MLAGKVDEGWGSYRNRVLALGLTQYEATLCVGCGLPIDEAKRRDARLEADSIQCRGCEMLHDAHGEHDKPGTRYYVALGDKSPK